ncbi:hypothetical protein J2Y67_004092 [Neobacillus niacini]|nr:hypothetical protein [Neobacillus niacini]
MKKILLGVLIAAAIIVVPLVLSHGGKDIASDKVGGFILFSDKVGG